MSAVFDASVLVALLVDRGPVGRWAESRRDREDVAVPHLAPVEASNVLRRQVAHRQLSVEEASRAHVDLAAMAIELYPFGPFAARIWELRENVTSYDAWYVAVAEALDCPLLTLDDRLARAPGLRCEVVTPPPS